MEHESERYPGWALRERQSDLAWIGENLHVFWPMARAAYREQGRGALAVDTTVQPVREMGHPFVYLPQYEANAGEDEDLQRMVSAYDPQREFVVTLLKTDGRSSTYRLQVQPHSGA